MGHAIRVEHLHDDRFEILVRQHAVFADQPIEDGGDDTAPTPTELFVASLASCAAFYARRFLLRHGLPTEGLAVEAEFAVGSHPARVSEITLLIRPPEGVPEHRHPALLAVASHCTVHNSLSQPPDVRIGLAVPAAS